MQCVPRDHLKWSSRSALILFLCAYTFATAHNDLVTPLVQARVRSQNEVTIGDGTAAADMLAMAYQYASMASFHILITVAASHTLALAAKAAQRALSAAWHKCTSCHAPLQVFASLKVLRAGTARRMAAAGVVARPAPPGLGRVPALGRGQRLQGTGGEHEPFPRDCMPHVHPPANTATAAAALTCANTL